MFDMPDKTQEPNHLMETINSEIKVIDSLW